MGIVLGAMGDSGYGVAYRVLDAQHFGVPQRRRRVFIVAGRRAGAADSRGPVQVLLEPEGSAGNPAKGWTAGQEPAGTSGDGFAGRRIVNALTRDGLGGGGPDDNLAQAGHLIPQQPSTPPATLADSEPSRESTLSLREVTGGGPRLASSSRMQRVASTVTTGTGQRMDPDTESLVVT